MQQIGTYLLIKQYERTYSVPIKGFTCKMKYELFKTLDISTSVNKDFLVRKFE